MVIKIKHILMLALTGLFTLLMTGCKAVMLDPKGIIAADEKHLIIICVLLMLTIVIPVIVLTIVFAWRYRAGNLKATYSPNWEHSTLIEIICWSAPCLIITILSIITWTSTHRLDPFKPLAAKDKTIQIEVIALDWKWLFIYPEQGIATVNLVQFPANVPIRFDITSEGPMNSFQIPQLAGQIYAMAGMKSQLNLMANSIGDYQGISANFSGEGFSEMKFIARVCTEEQFAQWVKTVKKSPEKLSISTYNQLTKPSTNNHVEYFSSFNESIFNAVIMKSMMPMRQIM